VVERIEEKTPTTCYFHVIHENDLLELKRTLNGLHGEVGLVGKVNTVTTTQKVIIDRLDALDAKFWKLTIMMLGGLGIAALNLLLLLAKGWV
jgi:hypothetical protein